VQILALAADTGEAPVDEALSALLREDQAPTAERVRARLINVVAPAILDAFTPELTSYDRLSEVQEVSA
jgi:hypothetical protein